MDAPPGLDTNSGAIMGPGAGTSAGDGAPPDPAIPPGPGMGGPPWGMSGGGWLPPGEPAPRPVSRRRRLLAIGLVLLLAIALAVPLGVLRPGASPASSASPAGGHATGVVRIAGWSPATYDPGMQGDAGTAALLAQVFEGLTALDASMHVQPALAQSWAVSQGGLQVTFHLRPGITFSDGTPITADDVVASWLHVLSPGHPGPLASLLDDVVGAIAYRQGQGPRSGVGIMAQGDAVIVRLVQPAEYFPAIAANPALAVAPPSELPALDAAEPPTPFVGSGAYTIASVADNAITLRANPRYWAGTPSIETAVVVTDFGGSSPVDAFSSGQVDYTPIAQADALWIRYDPQLGPQLREEPSLSITYYGFDTRRAPFDDVRVRQAFAWAVDWQRIALLADGPTAVATSMVPPGIPGRPAGDFMPTFDPAAARARLAAAGYPDGRGLPPIALVSDGSPYDAAVARQLEQNLGVNVSLEVMGSEAYMERLANDTPSIWSMSWIADYPAPEDFLGVLLQSDATSNYGGWRNAAFDAALATAGRTAEPAAQERAYAAAETILQQQVPVIPLSYASPGSEGTASWALSRTGLLGATTSGLGIPRFAGMAWSR